MNSSKIKQDLVKLFNANQHSDPQIDHMNEMTLNSLFVFQERYQDKYWSSHEEMIEVFIDQMKYLHCSVYVHNEILDFCHD